MREILYQARQGIGEGLEGRKYTNFRKTGSGLEQWNPPGVVQGFQTSYNTEQSHTVNLCLGVYLISKRSLSHTMGWGQGEKRYNNLPRN